jgi:hypothetical protein
MLHTLTHKTARISDIICPSSGQRPQEFAMQGLCPCTPVKGCALNNPFLQLVFVSGKRITLPLENSHKYSNFKNSLDKFFKICYNKFIILKRKVLTFRL